MDNGNIFIFSCEVWSHTVWGRGKFWLAMANSDQMVGWRQDNRNRSNQESKFDFLATRQRLVKISEGQQKIKIVRTNR